MEHNLKAIRGGGFGNEPAGADARNAARGHMVGAAGFEPTTSGTQNQRATRLRHAPTTALLQPHPAQGKVSVRCPAPAIEMAPTRPPAGPAHAVAQPDLAVGHDRVGRIDEARDRPLARLHTGQAGLAARAEAAHHLWQRAVSGQRPLAAEACGNDCRPRQAMGVRGPAKGLAMAHAGGNDPRLQPATDGAATAPTREWRGATRHRARRRHLQRQGAAAPCPARCPAPPPARR